MKIKVNFSNFREYYCNKLYPKLNGLERNLRKLLFNTYIVNFGKSYYERTINKSIQGKAKQVIRARGNKETKKETKKRRKKRIYKNSFIRWNLEIFKKFFLH